MLIARTAGLAGLLLAAAPLAAQTSIFHDPFLNWDFFNYTNQVANDFEIVVAADDWTPPGVYTGGLGFPQFSRMSGDFSPDPGMETLLRWSGRDIAPGTIAHVGAAMMGSGRILDAYWTRDGVKIGPSIGITYELTRVTRPATGGPASISMILNTSPAFISDNPGAQLQLMNIRTFADIPADRLGLDDLTRDLDLNSLDGFETQPGARVAPLVADSFFDVFVDLTVNDNPGFEALLVADVVLIPAGGQPGVIGRFWNLNPQSPEPSGALLFGGVLSLLAARRRRAA